MVQCFGALCISSRSRKSHSHGGTVVFAGREVPVKVGILGGGLAFATELGLPAKHQANASFTHNFCANNPILKILKALESACLAPKLVKLPRYRMTYMAWGIAAKKLRCEFNFWWLKALGRKA